MNVDAQHAVMNVLVVKGQIIEGARDSQSQRTWRAGQEQS